MDLHVHSIFSDGELTPHQIIKEALNKKIRTISITDHDSIKGYSQGHIYAKSLGINLIPGVELTTDTTEGEVHILGYLFDPHNKKLLNHLQKRKLEREIWGKKLISFLRMHGYQINWEDCLRKAEGGIITRTHIALEILDLGYFESFLEAYNMVKIKASKICFNGTPFTSLEAIELIHEAGGEAYLAHPGCYDFFIDLEELIKKGLDGLEVYHSLHSVEKVKKFASLAQKHNLKESAGSDFHGYNSKNPFPLGGIKIPSRVYKQWQRTKWKICIS